jgi:hypothetical protein
MIRAKIAGDRRDKAVAPERNTRWLIVSVYG